MQLSRKQGGVVGIAVILVAYAAVVGWGGSGFLPGSVTGASGEDPAKLALVERLQAQLHPGATAEEAEAALSRSGVAYGMRPRDDAAEAVPGGAADYQLTGTVERTRWDRLTTESVLIKVAVAAGRVDRVEFKRIYTGP